MHRNAMRENTSANSHFRLKCAHCNRRISSAYLRLSVGERHALRVRRRHTTADTCNAHDRRRAWGECNSVSRPIISRFLTFDHCKWLRSRGCIKTRLLSAFRLLLHNKNHRAPRDKIASGRFAALQLINLPQLRFIHTKVKLMKKHWRKNLT